MDGNVNKKSFADDYLSAVKSGDMKTAQKLVDEAAESAMSQSKIRGEELTPEGAMEELVADTLSGIASDKRAMEAFLGLSEKEKSTLRRVLESLAERIKTFADTLTGAESRILVENSDHLLTLAREMNKALKKAGENAKTQKNTAPGDAKYSIANVPNANIINQNINDVTKMNAVVVLSGTEFAKSNVDLITQVSDYFEAIGGYVETPNGRIELTRTGVKSSVGHGIGRNKAVAFKAVPDVLAQGKIIDYQFNWKNRGYDTAVIAAPITITGTDYYLAVVVIVEKQKNSYYLHEIALQEK